MGRDRLMRGVANGRWETASQTNFDIACAPQYHELPAHADEAPRNTWVYSRRSRRLPETADYSAGPVVSLTGEDMHAHL